MNQANNSLCSSSDGRPKYNPVPTELKTIGVKRAPPAMRLERTEQYQEFCDSVGHERNDSPDLSFDLEDAVPQGAMHIPQNKSHQPKGIYHSLALQPKRTAANLMRQVAYRSTPKKISVSPILSTAGSGYSRCTPILLVDSSESEEGYSSRAERQQSLRSRSGGYVQADYAYDSDNSDVVYHRLSKSERVTTAASASDKPRTASAPPLQFYDDMVLESSAEEQEESDVEVEVEVEDEEDDGFDLTAALQEYGIKGASVVSKQREMRNARHASKTAEQIQEMMAADPIFSPSMEKANKQGMALYLEFCHLAQVERPFPLNAKVISCFILDLGYEYATNTVRDIIMAGVKRIAKTRDDGWTGFTDIEQEFLKRSYKKIRAREQAAGRCKVQNECTLNDVARILNGNQYRRGNGYLEIAALLLIGVCTGARGCTLTNIKWKDILSVQRHTDGCTYVCLAFRTLKGNKHSDHEVTLAGCPEYNEDIISRYCDPILALNDYIRCSFAHDGVNIHNIISYAKDNEKVRDRLLFKKPSDCYNKALQRFADKIGVPAKFWHLHNVRSGFVMDKALEARADPVREANVDFVIRSVAGYTGNSRQVDTYMRKAGIGMQVANAGSNNSLQRVNPTRGTTELYHRLPQLVPSPVTAKECFQVFCQALKTRINRTVEVEGDRVLAYYHTLAAYAERQGCVSTLPEHQRNTWAQEHVRKRCMAAANQETERQLILNELLALLEQELSNPSINRLRSNNNWKPEQVEFIMEKANDYMMNGKNISWRKIAPAMTQVYPAPEYSVFNALQIQKKFQNERLKIDRAYGNIKGKRTRLCYNEEDSD